MATILLAAAGGAVGAGFGGTVLGLSGAVLGRAVGATLGRVIDQQLLGAGSQAVETGRVSRFALTGASEGAPVSRVWGRVRIGGQVIWATQFLEHSQTSGGGKGVSSQPRVTRYSYTVSLAIALCEGEIARVGRIWADGMEIARDGLNLRVYTGSEDQQPDPKIEAVQGAGMAPAYRGIAYVVIEDLDLGRFGNRVPQFSFEVMRSAQGELAAALPDLSHGVKGVAMIPGTGEYALATTPVHYSGGPGVNVSANVNTVSGKTDFATSLEVLGEELPGCRSVSLVVSWFGGDLRCGACRVEPKAEQADREGVGMAWRAGGIGRAEARLVPDVDGRPIYGGTPADGSVIEAIRAIRATGQEVMLYPFVLMDQMAGNGLPDPWGGAEQAALPWRGRISLSVAPGRAGSPDRTAQAEAEVAAFFGTVRASDFAVAQGEIVYSGPAEWSYRRFVLHYAHLAALAGGVDAFCVGSELRGVTQARGAGDSFPAVAQLRALAADVRGILGAGVKISYAADWSEYGAYQSPEGGTYFPLDPFWADETVDFVGIDNYLPLSDWRDGLDHADAGWGAIYNLDYLMANVEGGKDYDWFYPSPQAEAVQLRRPIEDGAYGEPWVFRAKDFTNWWGQAHHERPGGLRAETPTAWVPQAKPIRFTEMGCPAIDKGTNEPNKFVDPKSSESALPRFSRGTRDDLMQLQYLRAMIGYWGEAAHNPVSAVYGGPMVDMAHAHVWCWDARPYPAFPNATALWADGANYALGHWITGRAMGQSLANVVAEVCAGVGVTEVDTSRLYGYLRGYSLTEVGTARSALQPLLLAYAFDVAERDGRVNFVQRGAGAVAAIDPGAVVDDGSSAGVVQALRAAEADVSGCVRVNFTEADGDYQGRSAEALFPDESVHKVAQSDLALVMTQAEGRTIAERWLAEARVARDGVKFALPPSQAALGAGDVVTLEGADYRIDRVEDTGAQAVEAVRVAPDVYVASDAVAGPVAQRAFAAPVPVYPLFMDLPLLTGDEVPQAPHLAVTATPWPGSVACYSAAQDAGYGLNLMLTAPAVVGITQNTLRRATPGLWDRGEALRVQVFGGALSSAPAEAVLAGANVAAIGDGSPDGWEVFQFANATLVAERTYELTLRLRGQAGTDALMPEAWPAGSTVVLLNAAVEQIDLPASLREVAQHYRIGPAARGYDDPSYTHLVEAFAGVGLRPYAPCHLRAVALGGDLRASWIRRTRIDGESWSSSDVPLGEAGERYIVRVSTGAGIVREATVGVPSWTYGAAQRAADGVTGAFTLSVAQISDRFGAGPFTEMGING
ncbi:MAG: glycoside hydrolase/phage tail family protein [Paracoccaceae bacterium]|nr:glycoside hydrolase/phage tail family protein [Paracoccaceae bacterium]